MTVRNKNLTRLLLVLSVVLGTSTALEAAGLTPAAPSNLQGSVADGVASLSWDVPEDDDSVVGYNLYINNAYTNTVFTNNFSTEVEPDTRNTFTVVAFDEEPRNFSQASDGLTLPASLVPDDLTVPPSVPTGLQGDITDNTVTLTWEPSTDDEAVLGYNVYRDNQYLTTVQSPSFIGDNAAGESHAWYVVAFDIRTNFSARSERIVLPDQGPVDTTIPPSVPTGLAGEVSDGNALDTVTLTWQPATDDQAVAGYNIYRNNEYRSTVFTNAYSDTVTSGVAFAYSVVAFDSYENFSARSAPLNLLGDENQPPFFSDLSDQALQVGVLWELVLSPVDIDGGAAGILVSELPAGMQFVDNFNGTRSLLWTPTIDDIGSFPITVSAFDLQDTDLRTTQTITLTVSEGEQAADAPFALSIAQGAYNLQEGNPAGVDIPVELTRDAAAAASSVTLNIRAVDGVDGQGVSARFSTETLDANESISTLNLQLEVGVLPIQSGQRRFVITATDGSSSASTSVTVASTPVQRDDVYLLLGQSNMVGFSEAGAKEATAGGLDERDLRIRQANVQANNSAFYPSNASYVDTATDFRNPLYVLAEDPLHDPVDFNTLAKEGTRIGLSLSFAKAALPSTTRNVVLVPAAWASSGFCDSAEAQGNWNAIPGTNPALGNTLLFDRALSRINKTLQDTGGILRGILWHQGESDSNEACAELYEENLTQLVAELRTRIVADARGSEARGPDANIPFVVGTMSRGSDDRGDLSSYSPGKMIVDTVHRTISSLVPFSDVVLNDDLVPANGYPCGEGSCIHFGAAALREMGSRSYEALLRAVDE